MLPIAVEIGIKKNEPIISQLFSFSIKIFECIDMRL